MNFKLGLQILKTELRGTKNKMTKKIIALKKKTAKIVFFLGLAGVVVPHIAFLADIIPTLDMISHPIFELASAFALYLGYINK